MTGERGTKRFPGWKAGAFAWTFLVVFLSVWPFADTPHVEGSDKVAHFIIYAFTTMVYQAAGFGVLRSLVFSVGLGSALELVQAGLPWRSFSEGDLLANAAGAGCIALLIVAGIPWPRVAAPGGRGKRTRK